MRTSSLIGFVALVAVFAVGVLLYLSYGLGNGPPAEAPIEGLQGPVTLRWYEPEAISITATSEADQMAALGFAHGTARAWPLLLWRQAALGQLARWLGDPGVVADRWARRLQLASGARAAYAALDPTLQPLLDAYAAGMNAALTSRPTQLDATLARLDVPTEPWEPWHSLAVERLLAWLAAQLDPGAAPDSLRRNLMTARTDLQRILRLHGFEHSQTWSLPADTAGSGWLVQRHVYGATALPLALPVRLEEPGGDPIDGASLLGTPYLLGGAASDRAWAVLLSSTAALQRIPVRQGSAQPSYERVELADGGEQLVTYWTVGDQILLAAPPEPDSVAVDTLWALAWTGQQHGTDLPAWRALARGEAARFQLFRGDGLQVRTGTRPEVLGQPVVQRPIGSSLGRFVGNSVWSAYAGRRLDSLHAMGRLAEPEMLTRDAHSVWAEEALPVLLQGLDSLSFPSPRTETSYRYLDNWDFSYDYTSTGAALFEAWAALIARRSGTPPLQLSVDSLNLPARLRLTLLATTVDSLAARFGDNLERWRWGDTQPDVWLEPAPALWRRTAAASSLAARTTSAGHVSTLAWGPSLLVPEPAAPAVFEAWSRTGDGAWVVRFRPRPVSARAPGDSVVVYQRPTNRILSSLEPVGQTTLRPR